jgi:hypothetical protein
MRKWGCFGLTVGGLMGLLLAFLFLVGVRQMAVWPEIPPMVVASPDATLFLSENSISYFATEALKDEVLVDLRPHGQMQITTRAPWGRLRPVIHLGLTLEMQEQVAVSRLHWAQMGFIKFPAGWLPQSVHDLAAMPGEAITRQVPAGFHLPGFNTTEDGIEFYLNWVGP